MGSSVYSTPVAGQRHAVHHEPQPAVRARRQVARAQRRRSADVKAMTRGRALALFAVVLSLPAAAQEPVRIGLDHIPVAVRDLEAASATYRALGFSLKPGRPHANGIRNAHVKFPDGAGIELLTVPAAVDPLSTKYVDIIRAGDGPAFLSFHARDTTALHAALRAGGYAFRDTSGLTDLHGTAVRLPVLHRGQPLADGSARAFRPSERRDRAGRGVDRHRRRRRARPPARGAGRPPAAPRGPRSRHGRGHGRHAGRRRGVHPPRPPSTAAGTADHRGQLPA